MLQHFYKLPLEPGRIILRQRASKCSLKESIAHHLHLVLTTSFGELVSDPRYGNPVWDEDFDYISYRNRQKENLLQSLTETILRYEQRIEKIKVEMNLYQEENPEHATARVRKRLEIVITGVISATNEAVIFRDNFFISPLAYN